MVIHPDLAACRRHHQEGRAQSRRLGRAAAGGAEERRRAGHGFLTYFVGQVVPHIRGEESLLFPLLFEDERGVLARLLVEHEHFYVLARRLAEALAGGAPEEARCRLNGCFDLATETSGSGFALVLAAAAVRRHLWCRTSNRFRMPTGATWTSSGCGRSGTRFITPTCRPPSRSSPV